MCVSLKQMSDSLKKFKGSHLFLIVDWLLFISNFESHSGFYWIFIVSSIRSFYPIH